MNSETNEEILKSILGPFNIFDFVLAAQKEAAKRCLNVNALFINDRLLYSRLGGTEFICGLRTIYTNELPDDFIFAVCHADNLPKTKDEEITRLIKENADLKERLARMEGFLKGGEDNE